MLIPLPMLCTAGRVVPLPGLTVSVNQPYTPPAPAPSATRACQEIEEWQSNAESVSAIQPPGCPQAPPVGCLCHAAAQENRA